MPTWLIVVGAMGNTAMVMWLMWPTLQRWYRLLRWRWQTHQVVHEAEAILRMQRQPRARV